MIGEQLSSVTFVQDYLQLAFDGWGLTCYARPTVAIGAVYRVDKPGYRDALCSLIASEVRRASGRSGEGLVIRFEPGAIVLNPTEDELAGPEIAVMNGPFPTSEWNVWREGEGIFAHK